MMSIMVLEIFQFQNRNRVIGLYVSLVIQVFVGRGNVVAPQRLYGRDNWCQYYQKILATDVS